MTSSTSATGGLPPGTKMGRYELLHRLAMGGMAELYVARQTGIEGFERTVVLKRVLPHLTEDPEFIRMFLDEARIAASLDHPNVAQVTDIDEQRGEYFFAMEYVHGKNLREVLKRAPDGLPRSLALTIVTNVAAGLHHAHEALGPDGRPLGLVHRDVSPSNVMIAYSGAVKLTDFGIAKASARTSKTLAGRIKGKVGYMSPEQCRGEDVDRRSDIFALGIVLYEVTTGARAFYAPNDFAAMARIVKADYTRPTKLDPEFPPQLERIIARALQKEPDDRYATAEQMQLDLEAFAEQQGHTLGTIELARHMRETFGNPAHPQTLPVPRPVTPHEAVTFASRSRKGVGRTALLSAALGSAVVAAGVALAMTSSDDELPRSPPATESTRTRDDVKMLDSPAEQSVVAASEAADSGGSEGAPDGSSPATEGARAEEEQTVASEPEQVRAQPTSRRASKPRKRRRKSAKKRKPKSGPSPYPPGYER